MDKILSNIRSDKYEYQPDHIHCWNNKNFVLGVVKINGDYIKFASDNLKNNREIVFYSYKNSSDELKNSRGFVLDCVKIIGSVLQDAPEIFRDDEEIVWSGLSNSGYTLKFASDRLKDNKKFAMKALEKSSIFEFLSENLRNDKEIALFAVQKDGYFLMNASKRLKNDQEVVLKALESNLYAYSFMSEELKKNIKFNSKLIKIQNGIWFFLDPISKKNRILNLYKYKREEFEEFRRKPKNYDDILSYF